jgi:uncharacterized protein YaaW (UPF0174 family)
MRESNRFVHNHTLEIEEKDISDTELEQLVLEFLESMEDENIQELCKALEILFCYIKPVIYH